ncbi:hypothetical protein [Williamsia sp.]|uniref:hypothetical protein n=1 Tax=Williamsia sp. TaxID=1872085 RepID=UPI002F935F5D
MNERLDVSNPPLVSWSSETGGQARLNALVSAQRNRWAITVRSSDFRSIVGVPWVD